MIREKEREKKKNNSQFSPDRSEMQKKKKILNCSKDESKVEGKHF